MHSLNLCLYYFCYKVHLSEILPTIKLYPRENKVTQYFTSLIY